MNWLAHVLLSTPEIEFRLGNLLADLVKGPDRAAMSAAFKEGVRHHQAIDAFTDTHPVFHRSRARIRGNYPHAKAILVDVFYDHFLACEWNRYWSQPLEAFTSQLYADIRACPMYLPPEAKMALDMMIREDRLASYRRIEGIEDALRRLSLRIHSRIGIDLRLDRAISELIENYNALQADFREFFPQLWTHAAKAIDTERQNAS